MKSLTRIEKDGGIVRKFGRWSLLFQDGHFFASGDYCGVNITVYCYPDGSILGGFTWAADFPERLPRSIVDYIHENYEKMALLHAAFNQKKGL